jgi:chromosome segregation ATPase
LKTVIEAAKQAKRHFGG